MVTLLIDFCSSNWLQSPSIHDLITVQWILRELSPSNSTKHVCAIKLSVATWIMVEWASDKERPPWFVFITRKASFVCRFAVLSLSRKHAEGSQGQGHFAGCYSQSRPNKQERERRAKKSNAEVLASHSSLRISLLETGCGVAGGGAPGTSLDLVAHS